MHRRDRFWGSELGLHKGFFGAYIYSGSGNGTGNRLRATVVWLGVPVGRGHTQRGGVVWAELHGPQAGGLGRGVSDLVHALHIEDPHWAMGMSVGGWSGRVREMWARWEGEGEVGAVGGREGVAT